MFACEIKKTKANELTSFGCLN